MDWDVFWSVLVVMFIVVPAVFIWAFAIVDLFGRPDLGGLAKVLWLLFIIFLPLLGTLAYFLFRPAVPAPTTPEASAARAGWMADTLAKLSDLREKGVISDEEFERQRTRVLSMAH